MSGETRYFVAVAVAQQILELPAGVPDVERPRRLAKLAYLILEAMDEAESKVAAEHAFRFLCPNCYRLDSAHLAYGGRRIKCRLCGHRWWSPETTSRN